MISKSTHIQDAKKLLGRLPTIYAPVPEYLFIATDNARCAKADIFVKEGDHVDIGQVIGMRHAAFFDQPIHATCSGTFEGYENHYHRSGKMVKFMKLHNDFKETKCETIRERTQEEIDKLTKDDITEILMQNASVGLGGSSFPTHVKFQTKEKINTILLNGIECEPYITADHRLMLEESQKLIEGIKIIMKAFDCHDARICVKSKYHDIREVYGELLKRYEGSGITICPVKNYYPQGWEIAMIKEALGVKIPSGQLPAKYGIIDFNVSTVVGIYQSVKYNMPVIERNVSVTGDGIKYPSNFTVRVGTPIKGLIDICGGYKNEDREKVFILGGPMMGASLPSDDCIITKTVTSVIVLNRENYHEEPCIRCGSCVYSCPVGISPVLIMNAMKVIPVDRERVKALEPLKCVECGLCTYSCTSKIRVTDYVRRAKTIAKL
ncbi:MAG: RnfABCDGE type electron transport complex subunit C [Bacilli bacterium]|nr:RnfABCDGE type electron transport complex subunit C [Bacilli bacterium]